MRYGIVREIEGQPPPSVQRYRIEAAGCDIALPEGTPTPHGQRALRGLLRRLKHGDELAICSLDVLQMSTGELAVLLQRFSEVGVTLRLVGGSVTEIVRSDHGVPRELSLLAEHEARRPTRPQTLRRSRAHRKPLSRYQIEYARTLHHQGQSLRMIGLLFQVTPRELLELMDLAPTTTVDDG